jgi:hypothetical protein
MTTVAIGKTAASAVYEEGDTSHRVYIAVGYTNGGPQAPTIAAFTTKEKAKAYAYDLSMSYTIALAFEAIVDDPKSGTEEDEGATQL